jgi:hypothetical protein
VETKVLPGKNDEFWFFGLNDSEHGVNFDNFGLSASSPTYPSIEVEYNKDDPPVLAFFICRERLKYLDPARFEAGVVRDLLERQKVTQLDSRAKFLKEYCEKFGQDPKLYPAPQMGNVTTGQLSIGPREVRDKRNLVKRGLEFLSEHLVKFPLEPRIFFSYANKNAFEQALDRLLKKIQNSGIAASEVFSKTSDSHIDPGKVRMVLPLVAGQSPGAVRKRAALINLILESVEPHGENIRIVCYWFEIVSPMFFLARAARILKELENPMECFYEDLYGNTSYFKVHEKDVEGVSEREGLLLNYGVRLEENLSN